MRQMVACWVKKSLILLPPALIPFLSWRQQAYTWPPNFDTSPVAAARAGLLPFAMAKDGGTAV